MKPVKEFCDECCGQPGGATIGVPGVIGTMAIERCDACQRFDSDTEAEEYLRRLVGASYDLLQACKAALTVLPNGIKGSILDNTAGMLRRAITAAEMEN